ncbi:MAG: DUF1350 domain-containing protein [Cyanothece sp. SIO2G6]|nr:DUF1350 domain-containing protein [Cyanothece sp. SIO2G6]
MEWQEIAGNWLLIPRHPVAIVHFLGGAFVAAVPQLTYRWLLEQLAKQQYAIVATPLGSAFGRDAFDHSAIARNSLLRFESALDYLHRRRLVAPDLPIYGLGHSLGSKLHLLNSSLFDVERAGNILMAFNNYPAKRAIPFYEQVSQASSLLDDTVNRTRRWWQEQSSLPTGGSLPQATLSMLGFPKSAGNSNSTGTSPFPVPGLLNQIAERVTQVVPPDLSEQISQQVSQVIPDLNAEFQPSPEETLRLVADNYGVCRTLLVQFRTDDIDQTDDLHQTLSAKFPGYPMLKQLPGNHLTPIGQDIDWSPGRDFSPVDAVGQFVKQGAYQSLNQLRQTVVDWLAEERNLRK